jgi:hypothetical protein
MSLLDQIEADLKAAMIQKDAELVAALRLLVAALKNAAIDKRGQLSTAEELKVLAKEAKQRQESIEAYQQASRSDLADKEKKELAVIKGYLPQQMSEDEVRELVSGLDGWGAVKGNFGAAMKLAMKQVAGRADGALVAKVVRELI